MAARDALSRHLECDLGQDNCNFFRNPVFKQSNVVLDGVLKTKKANGEEPAVEHKESIAADDLAKLDGYFKDVLDSCDPVKLTYFCWYNLSLHFALQGAEVQTKTAQEVGHRI